MSNTNQKSFKFPVGAIFLLISAFWTLLEFLDSISLLSDYYMEAYYGIYAIISFISLGTTITLCVFLFMKKSGLALAISSFAIAFSSLLGLFTPFAFLEFFGYLFRINFSFVIDAFLCLLCAYTFAAMGISAILPKSKGLLKAMKISSLIAAIVYVSLVSIGALFNFVAIISYGYLEIQMFAILFNAAFCVGLLLTRGWVFSFIEAKACSCECCEALSCECAQADSAQIPCSEPACSASEAEALIADEPACAAKSFAPEASAAAVAPPVPEAEAFVSPSPTLVTPAFAPAPKEEPAAKVKLSADDVSAQLRTYKLLLDDGIITQEEYDRKKKEILAIN